MLVRICGCVFKKENICSQGSLMQCVSMYYVPQVRFLQILFAMVAP